MDTKVFAYLLNGATQEAFWFEKSCRIYQKKIKAFHIHKDRHLLSWLSGASDEESTAFLDYLADYLARLVILGITDYRHYLWRRGKVICGEPKLFLQVLLWSCRFQRDELLRFLTEERMSQWQRDLPEADDFDYSWLCKTLLFDLQLPASNGLNNKVLYNHHSPPLKISRLYTLLWLGTAYNRYKAVFNLDFNKLLSPRSLSEIESLTRHSCECVNVISYFTCISSRECKKFRK